MMLGRLVLAIFFWNCVLLVLKSSLIDANEEANINCLRNIKSQVEDPNKYLSSWDFNNDTEAGFICNFRGVTCWYDGENRVLSIKLSGFGLRGVFPETIKECTDLTGLDLSKNNFSGPLPVNLSSVIHLVTTLDLSYNRFSGEIPTSIGNVMFLNTLYLQNNQFTGQLPPQLVLLGRLTKLNVANNRLTGPIPNFNESLKQPENFDNNMGLCGKPLDDCKSPTISSGKIVITAAVGGFTGSLVVGCILFFCFRKKDAFPKNPSRR